MQQIVVLSGKGGTGKTSVTAAFAHLAHEGPSRMPAVLVDADVDAPNLAMVLQPMRGEEHAFTGGSAARIDPAKCGECGLCTEICRFEAILQVPFFHVDPIACEGCAACVFVCPDEAIDMKPQIAGNWFRSQSQFGPLFHAELYPGMENSGKLVTLVKQHARLHALDCGSQGVIVDGPPGIGCPAISATSGADLMVVVTEPTRAGIHDMERVLSMAAHFHIPAGICINKSDIYPNGTSQIEDYCRTNGVEMFGHIPFDATVTEAMVHGQPVTAFRSQAIASDAMVNIWRQVTTRLEDE
jgi:MinD superfamily P-loop ATPase